MSASSCEFLVIGLGAAGSAVCCELARRGGNVIGIDRYRPPHSFGSSHGESRITRLAIGEGARYVPFAMRSHELWRRLEKETGLPIYEASGGLLVGDLRAASGAVAAQHGARDFVGSTIAAARRFGIEHQVLERHEVRERFPQFRLSDGEVGYYEPEAGFLRPENAITAQLEVATRFGATLSYGETAIGVEPMSSRIRVTTDSRELEAEKVVICAGPWLPRLVPELAPRLSVYRQCLFWFETLPDGPSYLPRDCPIFIWIKAEAEEMLYGFPAIDGPSRGVKIATEQFREICDPESTDRAASETARVSLEDEVAKRFDGLGRTTRSTTCLYSCTRDFGFLIGEVPEHESVFAVSACSGHGFKHSAAIGEAVAELCKEGAAKLDLSTFSLEEVS